MFMEAAVLLIKNKKHSCDALVEKKKKTIVNTFTMSGEALSSGGTICNEKWNSLKVAGEKQGEWGSLWWNGMEKRRQIGKTILDEMEA